MKYYLIAGEASGDLHASNLMKALKERDGEAQFRCIGGDLMQQEGGALVTHYREMAYMGLWSVVRHLPALLRKMRDVKRDIRAWNPDAVILVDYPGFNLAVAKYVHTHLRQVKTFYYIAPKIWASREYRIKSIRRDVDELFSILPFEKAFFEGKHHYPIHYVGNPTADEVREFLEKAAVGNDDFLHHNGRSSESHQACLDGRVATDEDEVNGLSASKPIIAVLCGSRKQEIKANLPAMLEATDPLADEYQVVVAGAPGIEHDFYASFTQGHHVMVLHQGQTYQLLYNAHAALVTSGTATLETALFKVPQVVCYATPMPQAAGLLRKMVLKVKYISLVNLIAGREVVPELVADTFSAGNISRHLQAILSGSQRKAMLNGYDELAAAIGKAGVSAHAAQLMVELLRQKQR